MSAGFTIQNLIDESRALPRTEDRAEEFEAFPDDAQSALDEVKADPSLLAKERDPCKEIENFLGKVGELLARLG